MTEATHEPGVFASFCLSSVHPLETTSDFKDRPVFTGHPPPAEEEETVFRHSGWKPTRNRVIEALRTAGSTEARMKAFLRCGSDAWVLRSKTDHEKLTVVASNCHDRFCMPCAQERAGLIRTNLGAILRAKQPVENQRRLFSHRFLTLTIQTKPGEPLRDSIGNLYDWFKALRSTVLWKRCVKGGAAFCEVKWIESSKRWHPHLHLITEGSYIRQDQLRETWRRITKTSHIVDVRALRNDEVVIRYVAKYASKPLNGSFSHSVERLREAIEALRGRKLCHCFGSWTKYRLLKTETLDDWEPVGRYSTLVQRAKQGNEDAIRIINALDERKSRTDANFEASLRSAECVASPEPNPP